MLATIGSFGVQPPVACQNTCAESWTVFNEFIVKYGSDYEVAEYTTRVLRRGITFFGDAVLPIAPTVITRMSLAFESTGIPAYLWIAGKLVTLFGEDESPEMRRSFADVYERSTQKVVSILQERAVQTIPDGELRCSQEYESRNLTIYCSSSRLPSLDRSPDPIRT